MGDEAEEMFEKVYPHGWERYGLKRPRIQVGKLKLKIRYTPDYVTSSSLIEVQGFGADQTVKLKLEKERALHQWNQDMPVQMFLWDSKQRRYGYIPIDAMTHASHTHGQLGRLDEKPAWFIQADDLEMEWVSAESS